MRYIIIAESTNCYHVKHFVNSYDYTGLNKTILKSKFGKWRTGKIDETNYNDIKQIEEQTNNIATITQKQKEIMDIVSKMVQNKRYIFERDINLDGYSKTLIIETVRNEFILSLYKLERVRANKQIKEQYGITSKGYPFIIVKV